MLGYGLFDKSANAVGNGATISVGPLTPATTGEIALFAIASTDGTVNAITGWFRLQEISNVFVQLLPNANPFTATAPVVNPGKWVGNLLFFPYGGASLTANITSVSVNGSDVCTVVCSNSFIAGTQATFGTLTNATFLNGVTVTLLTATPSQITFTFVHTAYGPTADSGTVYDVGVIQANTGSSGALTGTQSVTFSNPVAAGSTLMMIFLATVNANNNYSYFMSCSDSVNGSGYTILNTPSNPSGQPAPAVGGGLAGGGSAYVGFIQNALAGRTTISGVLSNGDITNGVVYIVELAKGSALALARSQCFMM